jgi:hypothetical protein
MPYTPTVWADEIPSSTPVKYSITDDVNGAIATSASIQMVTSVTSGTPMNAANFNKLEAAIQTAVQLAEQAVAGIVTTAQIVNAIWKVGDLYSSTSPISPATKYGVGTWEAYGAGKFLVGIDPSDSAFDTVGETGGAKTVSLTAAQNGLHTHTVSGVGIPGAYDNSSDDGSLRHVSSGSVTSASSGTGAAHENLPPYVVVYIWRRTA